MPNGKGTVHCVYCESLNASTEGGREIWPCETVRMRLPSSGGNNHGDQIGEAARLLSRNLQFVVDGDWLRNYIDIV